MKKVCYKVALCENRQRQSCKEFFAYLSVQKWLAGTSSSTWKFGGHWPTPLQNADFQFIFARSASAVTQSKRSSFNTNRKFTMHFPMSLRWTSCVAPKLPSEGAENRQTAVFRVKSHFAWRKWGNDGKSKCVVTYANSLTGVRRLAVATRVSTAPTWYSLVAPEL